jgi:hypothetical protein
MPATINPEEREALLGSRLCKSGEDPIRPVLSIELVVGDWIKAKQNAGDLERRQYDYSSYQARMESAKL